MESVITLRRQKLIICLFIVIVTLIAYWGTMNNGFIDYDDQEYITNNLHLKGGITFDEIAWAFTTKYTGYFHPLTWLSYMLDYKLYGLNPMGYHCTNLQIHIANTILLFLVINMMTGALWRSAFIAALFALHPLNVESVAWIAERKNVLSTFFGLLTLISYYRYVKNPCSFHYLLVIFFFVLSLMAKPMLVTLPFILLLLDYWPLKRFRNIKYTDLSTGNPRYPFFTLFIEKIPFFALSAITSYLTFLAQQSEGTVSCLKSFPINIRINNALVSYIGYVFKAFWPRNLSVFYPHPGNTLSNWQVLGSFLLIVAAIFLAVKNLKKYPYIAIGLFWYLGTLVPVIGLIQVGSQAMADRYTYIPLIGLFIVISWGISDISKKWLHKKIILSTLAVVMFVSLTTCTWFQVRYWKNSRTLFEHANRVTKNNSVAFFILGNDLANQGKLDKAVISYSRALQIDPNYMAVHNNLGATLSRKGDIKDAILQYKKALEINPKYANAHNNLANLLFAQGKQGEAVFHYQEAIKINPEYAGAHNNLANVLYAKGKFNEAILQYNLALRFNNKIVSAHYNLGNLLIKKNNIVEAMTHFAEAIRFKPDYAEAYYKIGLILAQKRKIKAAEDFFKKAILLDPDYKAARHRLDILKKGENDRKRKSQKKF